MGELDFDTAVNEAWDGYRAELTDRLSRLPVGGEVIIEQSKQIPEGSHALLTVTAPTPATLICRVDQLDLDPNPQVRALQTAGLTALGWSQADDNCYSAEIPRQSPGRLAGLAIRTLREIWYVMHPGFLDDQHPVLEPALDVVARPRGHQDLHRMVVDSLEAMSGQPVTVDADGDIPLPTGEVRSWLRVLPERPTLEFFGTVIPELDDLAAAYRYIATETLPFTGIKLVVRERCMVGVLTLEATSFSHRNLATALGQWLHFVAEARGEIMAALRNDPEPDGALPAALVTLMDRDIDGDSPDPENVAEICDNDPAIIVDFLRIAQQQEGAWAVSAERATLADDAELADACDQECRAWSDTARQLRAALAVLGKRSDQRPSSR